ncbi:uncharacterized protein YybS (DUF2232 family) [Thermolongibacillus altinsuensis]|uniref:Uncharacterized protein YybS (DUF2232 family) n=1 Tax=Thermolongibacillus altinsuensis TaxID=575256 RepID=A0A4R1QIJ9_9BACL|nr:YybS family protein [Thermolongibacillus altinsuensis]TCL52623.1 uncharacterized protein YybS (DUF2232 family) [Thermolongibacillus altinsuensis]GMB09777.1 membrane protein [Thermolongibacillus altinsuensis]
MKNTRILTEGAIQLAIFTVLLLISLYMPFIGIIATLFLSVPFIIFTIRHTYKNGLLLLLVSLIPSVWFGSIFSLPMAIMFGSSGVVMGHVWSKKQGRYILLLVGSLAFLINIVLLYIGSVLFFDFNFAEEIKVMMEEAFQNAQSIFSQVGQLPAEEVEENFQQALDLAIYLLPASLVLASVFLAWMTQLVTAPILKRLQIKIDDWPPFRDLMLPKSLLWYYLIVMILMFFPLEQGSFVHIALLNIFQILQLLMTIQGFSFIFYWAYQKKIAQKWAAAIVVLSLLFPFLLYLVRILGIIDLGFELRKRLKD